MSISKDRPMDVLLSKVKTLQNSKDKIKNEGAWRELALKVGVSFSGAADNTVSNDVIKVMNTYPMLNMMIPSMNYSYGRKLESSTAAQIADYIRLVDLTNGVAVV